MKNEKISITREIWESLREYKKAPFKKKYLELLEMEKEIDYQQYKLFS